MILPFHPIFFNGYPGVNMQKMSQGGKPWFYRRVIQENHEFIKGRTLVSIICCMFEGMCYVNLHAEYGVSCCCGSPIRVLSVVLAIICWIG